MTPTPEELEAAKRRLEPYLRGYPEAMIDSRRLRIANGTATEDDHRQVEAENHVLRELRRSLKTLEMPPAEYFRDGTTSDDWKVRYSCSVTVSIRASTGIDFHSSAAESITVHFPLDDSGIDLSLPRVAEAAATVYSRWRQKHLAAETKELLDRYTPEQLLEAAREIEERRGVA